MVVIKEKLQEIKGIIQLYNNKNIYNMDKSVLF